MGAADNEQIVLMSDAGVSVGVAPKLASHHANTPLHLAFSAYVFNARGQLLLTRRADTKKVFPGVWTNSCCGHPAPNESFTGAISRRLKHELGMTPSSISVALPNYRYRAAMNGIVENEICPVYIVNSDGKANPNPDEVSEFEWVSWQEFRRRIEHAPNEFSPWCIEQSDLLDPLISAVTSDGLRGVSRYNKQLSSEIRRILNGSKTKDQTNHWRKDVHERLEEYLSGGKLMRGSLMCFTHEIFGGGNEAIARKTAACLEILHGALLIHDDIMDGDSTRRGRPAMHIQYEHFAANTSGAAGRLGESMAICAADAAIFIAMKQLGSLSMPEAQKSKIIELFGNILETVCYGQMLDIYLGQSDRQPSRREIVSVMEQKTAVYSISLPLMAGAVLANQPQTVLRKLEELGRIVGTIFQIRDDELGVFGDSTITGKPVGSDIKEGKKTLLYYHLFRKASAPDRKRLQKIFGNPKATDSDIDFVREKLTILRIENQINRDVGALEKQAKKIIAGLKLSEPNKQTLSELVVFCAKRDV